MAKGSVLRKTLRSQSHRAMIRILVAARDKAGLTQRQLADRLRRPHSFVGRMEAGERRVDVVEFIEIARVLGADPRELFELLL
ncbi:MAG TPA: helix-turn-helix transcriptional regulator [Steroidobacteraceae bacterium]|jgi:transcriptional regulator with XRE-family HTH domain|nr:helix-turn-helix transcriptional regulator [Steroidobacteraceae bacterium]